MTKSWRIAVLGLALAAAGCGDGASDTKATPGAEASGGAPVAAPASGDWTESVIQTPQGGYLMGNPEAPVRLVEYASLTCPHCAEFSATATETLKAEFVRTGKVSWEFRNFVLNPLDVAASLLARCQGPGPVFKLTEQVYAEQAAWLDTFSKIPPAEQQAIAALPEAQQFAAFAKGAGLDQFFRARGLTEAKAQTCLADGAAVQQLVQLRQMGSDTDRITGTPSFLINGELQTDVYNWETLAPKLREAIG